MADTEPAILGHSFSESVSTHQHSRMTASYPGVNLCKLELSPESPPRQLDFEKVSDTSDIFPDEGINWMRFLVTRKVKQDFQNVFVSVQWWMAWEGELLKGQTHCW